MRLSSIATRDPGGTSRRWRDKLLVPPVSLFTLIITNKKSCLPQQLFFPVIPEGLPAAGGINFSSLLFHYSLLLLPIKKGCLPQQPFFLVIPEGLEPPTLRTGI